jgi:hypothetical protein
MWKFYVRSSARYDGERGRKAEKITSLNLTTVLRFSHNVYVAFVLQASYFIFIKKFFIWFLWFFVMLTCAPKTLISNALNMKHMNAST